ncbi:MAG: PaaI family thioesterase [Solirubrobacteraceae bacterium]
MAEPEFSRAPAAHIAEGSPIAEPVRGGHPDPGLLALPGLEQLRRYVAGDVPEAPLSRLTGMRLVSVGEGRATFRMPLTPWLDAGRGTVSPGVLMIPADAAMACAVMSQLAAWKPFTTSELALRVLRPLPPAGAILAESRVLDPGPPVALSEVTLRDEAGVLIAHGSSLCVALPAVSPHAPAVPLQPWREPSGSDTPDPWQRPLTGLPGIQPALHRFTSLAVKAAQDGSATLTLPASAWFAAPPPGRVQGGIVAVLADATISSAAGTTILAGTEFTPIELKLNLLRPLVTDGRPARADARVVHAGRRIAVATAEVTDADGRTIAIASGSGLVGTRT